MSLITSDHPVYVSAGTAVTAVVFPGLVELTQVAAFCSYVLACIASLLTIALAIKRWRGKHYFDRSDNEQL